MRVSSLVFAIAAILACLPSAEAATHIVRPDGTGDYGTIQEAIDAALSGDVIELTDGVFRGDGNRNLEYDGKALTVRSRNGADNCVIDCEGSADSEQSAFSFGVPDQNWAVVEGLTIINGYRTGAKRDSGGAIWCFAAAPLIRSCVFRQNHALGGGAIIFFNRYGPPAAVTDCNFVGNSSEGGGAILIIGGADPVLVGCQFTENRALDGGAVYIGDDFSDAWFQDCDFTRNEAARMGGAVRGEETRARFEYCRFRENSAREGGALYLDSGGTPQIEKCLFSGNGAKGHGGAVYLERTTGGTITDCAFISNDCGNYGGAIYLDSLSPAVRRSTLHANRAMRGSGIFAENARPTIEQVIMTNGQGTAVDGRDEIVTLTCSDLFGNDGGDWIGSIADQLGKNGNLSAAPQYCGDESEDLSLAADSPCLEAQSPCGTMGAFDQGCLVAPIRDESWGTIKVWFATQP